MEALNNNSNWDETRMQRLEVLYRDGLSFSLIAADIGVSRNAAIGKARRMALPKRIEITQCKPDPRRAANPKPKQERSRRAIAMDTPKRPVIIPDRDYRCSINELNDSTCRYPCWGPSDPHHTRLYCGCPDAAVSKGVPYCQRHAALCNPLHA